MKKINYLIFLFLSVSMCSLASGQVEQREPSTRSTLDEEIATKCLGGVQHWSMVKCVELERARVANPSQTNSSKDSIERGKSIFYQYCYACHGLRGKGNGPSAEYLRGPVFDLTRLKVQEATDKELMDKITKGNSPMPGFSDKFISKDDLLNVIKYIRPLSKGKDGTYKDPTLNTKIGAHVNVLPDTHFVVISPPVGAFVNEIPQDFHRVVINGMSYYTEDGTYYVHTSRGFQVIPSSAVVNQHANQTFTIVVPSPHGGHIPVILKRSGNGFTGPQGEFYSEFPKVSQLKEKYGK